MENEIPKVYSPETIEPHWARSWVAQKLYRPSDDPARPCFCLVIPPPNITGMLHMGHMLEHTEMLGGGITRQKQGRAGSSEGR